MQQLRGGAHPLVDRRLLLLLHPQPERDVVVHVHVREDGVALEDHRDAPPPRRQVGRVSAPDRHAALIDPLETGETAQQRRLAASGRTEQDDELLVPHLEVDAVDGGELAEVLPHPLESDVSHRAPFLPAPPRKARHRATRPQVVCR